MSLFDVRERLLRERIHVTDEASVRGGQWPEPKSLPSGLPDVPPFAAELLPIAFRVWVMDVAERMQCPPDFPAVAVLMAAGSLIGRQIAIRPKRRDDWTVVPNRCVLWGVVCRGLRNRSALCLPRVHDGVQPEFRARRSGPPRGWRPSAVQAAIRAPWPI